MHIPIPVPIGFHHSAKLSETVERSTRCEVCGFEYQYKLTRSVSGKSFQGLFGSRENAEHRARVRAQQRLKKALAIDREAVVCPGCRVLTPSLSGTWKRAVFMNVGGLILVVAFTSWIVGQLAVVTSLRVLGAALAAVAVVLGILAAVLPVTSPLRRGRWPFPIPTVGYTAAQVAAVREAEGQRLLSSESEDDRWNCPKCAAVNPTNTFQCRECKYSLV